MLFNMDFVLSSNSIFVLNSLAENWHKCQLIWLPVENQKQCNRKRLKEFFLHSKILKGLLCLFIN